MISDVERKLFAFERNTVLRAGAGTGKTEALTGLYVSLVAGTTAQGKALSPTEVVAFTFTERAAAEMRTRIGASLRALAGQGEPTRIATLVRQRLEELQPSADAHAAHFERSVEQFASARITTLHGFCAGLLRTHALDAGLDPDFVVLDETEAVRLQAESTVITLTEELASERDGVARLIGDFGGLWRGTDQGVVSVLSDLTRQVAESGLRPARWAGDQLARQQERWDVHRKALQVTAEPGTSGWLKPAWSALTRAHRALAADGPLQKPRRASLNELLDDIEGHLTYGSDEPAVLYAAAARLADNLGRSRAASEVGALATREAARHLWLLPAVRERRALLVSLVERVLERYALAKHGHEALDFSDLELRARDLLRAQVELRAELQRGARAVLVDEFQDTNPVQRDLICLLRARGGTDARIPQVHEIEPQGLFVVGDRKQSIYGFRGADVTVFEALTRSVAEQGGLVLSLQRSQRSTRPLVEAINAISARVLGEPAEFAFEMTFDPEHEALEPVHEAEPTATPAVEWLTPAEDNDARPRGEEAVVQQAEAVALRMRALVDEQAVVRGKDTAAESERREEPDVSRATPGPTDHGPAWRPAQYGDMALLLPRFTHVGLYLQALEAHGVPHVVVNGRGLMQTLEASDLVSLMQVITEIDDGRALAAVLRSPLVGLNDLELVHLADEVAGSWHRIMWPSTSLEVAKTWPATHSQRLGVLRDAIADVDRLGLGTVLDRVLGAASYRAVLSALPGGSQRVANLDRLLMEVVEREAGGEDGRAIALDFVRRQSSQREPQVDVVAQGEQAVQIMTVHQSKGLQFPIVFCADLARGFEPQQRQVRHAFEAGGLAATIRDPLGDWARSEDYAAARDIDQRRERAERLRLFYVQMTRARDRLVLVDGSLSAGGSGGRGIHGIIAPLIAELEGQGLVRRVVPAEPTARPELKRPTLSEVGLQRLAVQAAPARPTISTLEVSVTELEDHALCARRYRARHSLGLAERPRPTRAGSSPPETARRRGTLLHRALELVDFASAQDAPEQAASGALAAAGAAADDDDVRTRLLAFLDAPLAAQLAQQPAGRVRREMPFVLRVPVGAQTVVIRGQIDLLVRDADELTVIDYKVSAPPSARSGAMQGYLFQLGVYRAALQQAFGSDIRVTTALQFLDGRPREPRVVDAVLEPSQLEDLVRSLLRSREESSYPGRGLTHCQRIGCGYVTLCHPQQS